MICIDNSFLNQISSFIFENTKPIGANSYLVFSSTTLLFSIGNSIVVRLIEILSKTKLHDFEVTFLNVIYWCVGSFLVAFSLSIVNIVEISLISCFVLSLTWIAIFEKVFNNVRGDAKPKENPDEFTDDLEE